jgi:hypothetical protein
MAFVTVLNSSLARHWTVIEDDSSVKPQSRLETEPSIVRNGRRACFSHCLSRAGAKDRESK